MGGGLTTISYATFSDFSRHIIVLNVSFSSPILAGSIYAAGTHQGVSLPPGMSSSDLLFKMMQNTCARFGISPDQVSMPQSFNGYEGKHRTPVLEFEAARITGCSARVRTEIALMMTEQSQRGMDFVGRGEGVPLVDYMKGNAEPLILSPEVTVSGRPNRELAIPYEGKTYVGSAISELAKSLRERGLITEAARKALGWASSANLDLSGMKFVVMGAGAEIAPTPLLLQLGAEVLWLDTKPPLRLLQQSKCLYGTLVFHQHGADLLKQPREIAATIRKFANGDPVHIGAFATATGENREWRLAAAMNGIINRLVEEALIQSVAFYISPICPMVAEPEDVELAAKEIETRSIPGWLEFFWQRYGYIHHVNHYEMQDSSRHLVMAILEKQDISHLAAQWIEKTMMADAHSGAGITVSANVAGICRPRKHGISEASVEGLENFGIEIFEPDTLRSIMGLLLLHDLFNSEAAEHTNFAQQVHGGLYSCPYSLRQVMRWALASGLVRSPLGVLRNLLRR
jgi:hypothetical protein